MLKLPGSQYIDPRLQLSQQLITQGTDTSPVQHLTQGLARMAQAGLGGYMRGKAVRDRDSAREAMLRGLSARQWDIPEGEIVLSADGYEMEPGEAERNAAPAGGYAGALAALNGLKGNPNAAAMAPHLALQDFHQRQAMQQKVADRKAALGDAKEIAKFKANLKRLGTGPFQGKGMDAQSINMVLNGDPSSPAYQAAYARLAAPQITINPQTGAQSVIQPDMSWARKPPGLAGSAPRQNTAGETQNFPGASVTTKAGEKPLTADQSKSATFADRMAAASKILSKYENQGTSAKGKALSFFGSVGNLAQSEEYQLYDQAAKDWVTANLRKESGAVIGVEEMEQEVEKYFPRPGDGPEVIKRKREARAIAEKGMSRAAGSQYKGKVQNAPKGKFKLSPQVEADMQKYLK